MTSWSRILTAVTLNLNYVVELWNSGEPIHPRLHRRVLSILQRDLERCAGRWNSGCQVSSDLWFGRPSWAPLVWK